MGNKKKDTKSAKKIIRKEKSNEASSSKFVHNNKNKLKEKTQVKEVREDNNSANQSIENGEKNPTKTIIFSGKIKNLQSKILAEFKNFSNKKHEKINHKKYLIVFFILSFSISFIILLTINKVSGENQQYISESKRLNDKITLDRQEIPKEDSFFKETPINGIKVNMLKFNSLKNRPLAVMIDNSVPARLVQTNLNNADIIYESLVEGGWTRFMAIFYSDQSDFKVMPVRSVRSTFIDNLEEYNDILLYHVGGAYTPYNYDTNAIQRINDDGIKSLYYSAGIFAYPQLTEYYDEYCFARGIPGYSCKFHFTSTLFNHAVKNGLEDFLWEKDKRFEWKWLFDSENFTRSEKQASVVKYGFSYDLSFDAEWVYEPDSGRYYRKTGGYDHFDNQNGEKLWAETIILKYAPHKLNVDEAYRVAVYHTGKGKGLIFQNGEVFEVFWAKECNNCRTRFYLDENLEKEFIFKPGKIWFSIIPDTRTAIYE